VGKPPTATDIQVMVFFWVSALCSGYISDVSLIMGKLATATYIQVMVFFWVSALCSGYISDISDERTGSVLGVTEVVWMDVKVLQKMVIPFIISTTT